MADIEITLKLSRQKAELYKKKDAFYLFKLVGLEQACRFYPEHQFFMNANAGKTIAQIEDEINEEIKALEVQAGREYKYLHE